MTAAQYARTTRPTMGHASEQLVKDYHDGKLKYHHDALVRGYTSVKGDQYASYDGRFGRGIVVFTNYTTAYSKVSYFGGGIMSRVVDRLFWKCGPDRFRRLKNVSRETFGGLENQPIKRVGEPWRIDGDLDASENVAIYRFENGVRGVVVVTPYRAGVNYVRFYRLVDEPTGLLKEYFDNWEVTND